MRSIIVLLYLVSSFCFGQAKNGFSPDTATDLMQLNTSYTFFELYGSDSSVLPKSYHKVYTSDVIGMDNKFQVYEKGKTAVISFRGSTTKTSSWVENIYSAMIPAKGAITIDGKEILYNFANKDSAAVHAGYALTTLLLAPHVIKQIKQLNEKGIYTIMLTGHSQGGALSNMMRAYLENLPTGTISSQNKLNSYAFANPMCGNKEFAEEFNARFEQNSSSFRIINPEDFVPKMPMHYKEEGPLLNKEILSDWVFGKEKFDVRKLGSDILLRGLKGGLTAYINSSNKLIERIISFSHVKIEMPEYVKDINYFQTGILVELPEFEYPKILLDLSQFSEEEIQKMKPAEDGNYYKEENRFFQHSPYNYFVALLKKYDSKRYRQLKVMYLEENL